jgi:hypothetical protein
VRISRLQGCSACATQQKYFVTSKFSYLLFSNHSHKTKRPQIGGRLLIPNHLDQSLWLPKSENGIKSQIIFITPFSSFALPFTSFKELYENAGQKSFWWDKLACFEFSSSNFNLLGYILRTGVVALRASPLIVVKWNVHTILDEVYTLQKLWNSVWAYACYAPIEWPFRGPVKRKD